MLKTARDLLKINLRRLREVKGLKQPDLAEKAGLSLGTIRKIEQGIGGASPETLDELVRALKTTHSQLFIDEGSAIDRPKTVAEMPAMDFVAAIESVSQKIANIEMARFKKALDAIPEALRDVWKHSPEGVRAACMYLLTESDSFLIKSLSDTSRKRLVALRPLLVPNSPSDQD